MSIPISILYKLPESIEALLAAGSWLFLEHMELTSIGEIPVRVVEFESTKRNLDPSNSRSSSRSLSLGNWFQPLTSRWRVIQEFGDSHKPA